MPAFDLIVIGAGPGGYVAAIRAAQFGKSVAIVEREQKLGGTCLRVGCIPSKALLESSELAEQARDHFAERGIDVGGVSVDIDRMMAHKTKVVEELASGIDGLMKKNRIRRFFGNGRLTGSNSVEVVSADGETQSVDGSRILIATGSVPSSLPGIEPDGDRIGTSTEALEWPEVPTHLVVIGAGAIGLELGTVWRRLGAKVTVLEFLPRILPGIDQRIATEAQKLFTRQGMTFHLSTRVTAVTADGNSCRVDTGQMEPIECDRVLLSIGRRPCTDNLGLAEAGVETDGRGFIRVNSSYQTTVGSVYAIGDVIGGAMLAHKAEEEGIAVAERLYDDYGHVNYNAIPAVIYTYPEIAAVGRTEDELKEQGAAYKVGEFRFLANGRARAAGSTDGMVRVLADQATDRVLGVHIIGAHAGELIAEAAVAIEFGATSEDIARCCHAHPTLSEAVREAALAVNKRAIHS